MKRFLSPDAWVLIVALLLFAGLSYQMAQQSKPPKAEGDHPRRTTHSSLPGGWKAWYLLLHERGVKVRQTEKTPSAWKESGAHVVVCGPIWEGALLSGEAIQNGWAKNEVSDALKWVEEGGVLVMASDTNNDVADKFGLVLEEDPSEKVAHTDQPAVPTQPASFFGGVQKIAAPDKPYLSRTARSAPILLTRGTKTIMVGRTRGRGMILFLSTPGAFDNAHLSKDDNARFATQLVETFGTTENGDAPKVLFDEYHQGYRETDGFWEAVGRPGQLTALQILALVLLMVYGAGRRFGLPMPVPSASRVSSEYVTSLADLYRRARAYDAVLDGVFQAFWRDVCKAIGVPVDTPASEVIRRASAALSPMGTPTAAIEPRLTALVRECQEKIAGGPQALNEADLLRLARALSEMRKELSI